MTDEELIKLREADEYAARDIATLKERSKSYAERLDMHDKEFEQGRQNFAKLNDAISSLRETMSTVATKEDIYKLSESISKQFIDNLKDARNSVPGKWAAWAGVGMLVVMVITLVMGFIPRA